MPKRIKLDADPNKTAFTTVNGRNPENDIEPTPSAADIARVMSMLGKKGGKASGARRMTNLTKKQRTEIARKGGLAKAKKAAQAAKPRPR